MIYFFQLAGVAEPIQIEGTTVTAGLNGIAFRIKNGENVVAEFPQGSVAGWWENQRARPIELCHEKLEAEEKKPIKAADLAQQMMDFALKSGATREQIADARAIMIYLDRN